MHKAIFRDRYLLLLFIITILIRLVSLRDDWIETYYSLTIYPSVAKFLRTLLGWVPISVGDLLYIAAFIWLVIKTWKLIKLIKSREARGYLSWLLFRKYLKISLLIYVVFSVFWGLNYYRQGIEKQLGLELQPYSVEELFTLTTVLQQRLNFYAEKIDSTERLQYNYNGVLFKKGVDAYSNVERQFSYLTYTAPSIKSSIFTPVGHWFGFTGYYNPFTAEAQLKTSIPVYLKPFVITHEIAHQLGYAKENEASFVAYLTCKNSVDINFLYSVYFEMYRDALFECRMTPNKELVKTISKNVHPRVKWDVYDLRMYLLKNQNFIEPFMSGAYDRYLKLNNQPKGKATYNEVIAYLIAFMKKFGTRAI